MTDAQVAAVRARDLDRRVEKANFPYVKTLADFDFSFQPSLSRPVVEELASLGFLERRENVVLVGSPGVGKTHMA
ncbi:ATP-binding protein, partial [Enorma phocaeensis]